MRKFLAILLALLSFQLGSCQFVIGSGGSGEEEDPGYYTTITNLDTVEFDTTTGFYCDVILLDDTHVMIAYGGSGNDGYVKIYSFDCNYDLTFVSSLEFDTNRGLYSRMDKIDDNHVVIAYQGGPTTGTQGVVTTLNIDSSYVITKVDDYIFETTDSVLETDVEVIDSTHFIVTWVRSSVAYSKTFSIDANKDNITELDSVTVNSPGRYPTITLIDSTHLGITYTGSGNDGFIKTYSLDGSYNLTVLDTHEHNTTAATEGQSLMLDSSHIAFAYNMQNDPQLRTMALDGSYIVSNVALLELSPDDGRQNTAVKLTDGYIAQAYNDVLADNIAIETLSYDPVNFNNITQLGILDPAASTNVTAWTRIAKIDEEHIVLVYSGSGSDGYVKTFEVSPAPEITPPAVDYTTITSLDVFEHDTAYGSWHAITQMDETHFALAYTQNANDGFVATFEIDCQGNITELDDQEHDEINGSHNSILKLDDTHFAVAYAGNNTGGQGVIKVFSVDGSWLITEIESYTYETSQALETDLILLDPGVIGLSVGANTNDGYFYTLSYDGAYDITTIDSFEFNTTQGTDSSLVRLDDTHVAIAAAGSGSDGYLYILEFDSSFDNIALTSSVEHDGSQGTENYLVKLDSSNLGLLYADTGNEYKFRIFSIDGSYNITTETTLSIEANARYGRMRKIKDGYVAIIYQDEPGHEIMVETISYELSPYSASLVADYQAGTFTLNVNNRHDIIFTSETRAVIAYGAAGSDGYIRTIEFGD